jgi:hypothetical protein
MYKVLLELFYELVIKKSKYKRGLIKYIIYPFIWFCYKYKVLYIIDHYIEIPNLEKDFRFVLVEYVSFLNAMKSTLSPNPEEVSVNDLIRYKDTTNIAAIYNDDGSIRSITYIFKPPYAGSIKIVINVDTERNLILVDFTNVMGGTISFSYNNVINVNLINIKDNIEQTIRTDIAANVRYLLLEDKY